MQNDLGNLASLYKYDFGVLKDKLKLITMLMLLITVGIATSTPTTYLEILYYAKHFLEQGIAHRSSLNVCQYVNALNIAIFIL